MESGIKVSSGAVEVSHLYEEIKLNLVDGDASRNISDICGNPKELCQALSKRFECPVSGLFPDEDTQSLMVQLHFTDVGLLQVPNCCAT